MSRSDANYSSLIVQPALPPNSQVMQLAGPIDPPKPRAIVKNDEWNRCCPSALSCFTSSICPCIWFGCCVQVDYNTEAVFLNYGKVSTSLPSHTPLTSPTARSTRLTVCSVVSVSCAVHWCAEGAWYALSYQLGWYGAYQCEYCGAVD